MLEQLVKHPFHLRRYRNGPFADERRRYLTHLLEQGRGRRCLEDVNCLLLAIATQVDIYRKRPTTLAELHSLAEAWIDPVRRRSRQPKTLHVAKTEFFLVASNWLRFLGLLDEPTKPPPFADFLNQFLTYLREERGFSGATLTNRRRSLEPFLGWISAHGRVLATIQPSGR
jgi:integrase/recombinase XerD